MSDHEWQPGSRQQVVLRSGRQTRGVIGDGCRQLAAGYTAQHEESMETS